MQQTKVLPSIAKVTKTKQQKARNLLHRYGLDILIVLAQGILLYKGLFGQVFSDVPLYQCYAVAFWGGIHAFNTLPVSQCAFLTQSQAPFIATATLMQWMQTHHLPVFLIHFLASQNPDHSFHALPHEYPLPSLIPFILPLIVPPHWYQVAFAILMSLVASVIYGLLRYFRSRQAARACALYLVIGGWAIADGRFDLVPSAFTLVAIIFGVRKRWNLAFAFLALATVFKFYPLVLLLPFLVAQQREYDKAWTNWRRYTSLAVFAAICTAIMAVSLLLSIEGTFAPFSYYGNRPFQVESVAASVLWLSHLLGYPLFSAYAYGSLSLISPLSTQLSFINTALLAAGLVYTWWLQWRGKVDLAAACLLTFLIVIFTGKVFSPQYLLWIIPLAAYVGECRRKWVLAWCLLGGLTTYIFPYLYMLYMYHFPTISDAPLFYPAIAVRNLVFLRIIISLLVSYSRRQPAQILPAGDKSVSEMTMSSTEGLKAGVHVIDSDQPLLLWHKLALGGVLIFSAFLNLFALTRQDFFEYYYAAGTKSMLVNWHDFFFVAFDPGGFLALDKPPLGFWIQALSAWLCGYSVFSILLPGALAGILAVALLFHLVRRTFGPLAGLIAALILALSPISVATSRNNIVDSLLVLFVLLAAWMASKAAETGKLLWLCLCAVMIGLGFNIKFLQAYMVIPALGLVYLLGAPLRWRTKCCHLVLALVVMLLFSLSWATIVDLTPANQRPYIDSTASNSELDLAFGYNGIFRMAANKTVEDTWAWEIGRPGITRFLEQPLSGQCGWLLPLALLSLLALSRHKRWRLPLNRQQTALVLWGTWLFTMFVFFSNAHFFHLYYLSLLAPSGAALAGAGIVALWQDYLDYLRRGWRGTLLPAALLVTAAIQACFLTPFPQWNGMLTQIIVGCCASSGLMLILVRRQWSHLEISRGRSKRSAVKYKGKRLPMKRQPVQSTRIQVAPSRSQRLALIFMAALGLWSLLLAPAVWAVIPLSQPGRAFPMAGPPEPQAHVPALIADPVLEDYLLVHKGTAQFLFATMNTEVAAPFIVDTGLPVMALGGYAGSSSYLPLNQLIQRINRGNVHLFLLPEGSDQTVTWVTAHCKAVPKKNWQSPSTDRFSVDALQLYDCAHHS